jgi:hypothetical protein
MSNDTFSVSDELTKAIQDSINSADIRTVVQGAIDKQSAASAVLAADQANAEKAAADQLAAETADATSSGFSRIETIGGREFTFEAGSELELEQLINNAYKVAYAVQTPVQTEEAAPVLDAATVAAAAVVEADIKAALELKFKNGEISTADYLEQSGAIKDYLQRQGVPLDALKAAVDTNHDTQYKTSWEQATEQFKSSAAGSSWPGGDQNKNMIGLLIAQMGLLDAPDKVSALSQAYEQMKTTGMIFPGDDAEDTSVVDTTNDIVRTEVVAAPAAVATPAPAAAPKKAAGSSSMFNTSSGGSGNSGAPAPAAVKTNVDPNASPAEIMDAWKKAQVAAGKDPNSAFTETFANGGRRV